TLSARAGDPPTRQEVERLDIDEVAVTTDNGSVVSVPGTWVLEKQVPFGDGGATFVPVFATSAGFPTQTGVDGVPGTYRITTSYNTVEAGKKTTVNVVTVP